MNAPTRQRRPRILFSSYHSYLDPSSGSTISLRDLFQLLMARGWECQAFCGPQLDYELRKSIPELFHEVGIAYQQRRGSVREQPFVIYNAIIDQVPVGIYETPGFPANQKLTEDQAQIHLSLFERVLQQFQPDIVLTYGGHQMSIPAMTLARKCGAKVIFWLRNTAYNTRSFFREVADCLVPSTFSVNYYKSTIDLPCTAIPSPIDWERVLCPYVQRECLTFVNPTAVKGVYIFAGIVRALARIRPNLPLLVVESRGSARWLEQSGLDLQRLPNLRVMGNTRDPRQFLGRTRALLVPSLWPETFGRVTAEAMINGIPVLASCRGGLPEVVGQGGFLLDIPRKYQPDTREIPSEAELAPWIETILRLWDDLSFYVAACLRARGEAEKWRPEILGERYDRYFRRFLSETPTADPTDLSSDAGHNLPSDAAMPANNWEDSQTT